MSDYIKSTKKDFNPDIHFRHAGINDVSLSNTPVIVCNIVPRDDKNKEKSEKAIQIINNACVKRKIPVINHTNIHSKTSK